MATSAISSPNLSLLRSDQFIDDVSLHITPLVVVQTATITATPANSPYVSLTVAWDGATTGVKVGQMVKITNGTTLRAYTVVRLAVSGNSLFIGEVAIGNAGYPTLIESPIQIGDTVTIYSHHPLWGLYSRIANKQFYKMWNVAYSDQNEEPPPVANCGAWQVGKIAPGETIARFRFPRVGSNTSFAFGSDTITTYAWSLPTGVTLASGYALSNSVIEVDAEAGYHLIQLTVTDTNGKTHVAYTWLFVSDGTTGTSLSERYAVTLNSDNQTREGREIEFTVTGSNLEDVIFPRAGVVLREFPKFGGETLADGIAIDTFVGYITDITMRHDGEIGTVTCRAKSPFLITSEIAMPQQALDEKANAANWAQASSILMNPRGFLYYVFKWHCPAFIDMHDFDAPYTEPRRKFAQYNTQNVADAASVVTEYLAGRIGSSSDGATVLRRYPLYMSNTDRNALANIITFQEQDISLQAGFEVNKRFGMPYSEARTGAFMYNGSTVKAYPVQKRWYQGAGRVTMPDFTVTTTQGQAYTKEAVGHFLAEQNAAIQEITLELSGNLDVIDPVYLLWANLLVTLNFDAHGTGFNTTRMLPTQVNRTWELTEFGWLKRIEIGLQPETFGQPGEIIPISTAAAQQNGGVSPGNSNNYTPDLRDVIERVWFANDITNGNAAITYNIGASSPEWVELNPYLNSESVCDYCPDYGSSYYLNGRNPAYPQGVYIVTTSGTSLNVWNIPDIRNSLTPVLLQTLTMADSSVDTSARIECSETYPNLVIAAYKDGTGIKFTRSINGGVTWGSSTRVGSAITDDNSNDDFPLALAVDGQRQLISAPDGSGDYGIYYTGTAAGTFVRLTNTEDSERPQPLARIVPDVDTAYITTIRSGSQTITFDSSVDDIAEGTSDNAPVYAKSHFGGGTAAVNASLGNPTYCLRWTQSGSVGGSFKGLIFDVFLAVSDIGIPNVSNITFDVWFDCSGEDLEIRLASATGGTLTISSASAGGWVSVDWNADASGSVFPLPDNYYIDFVFRIPASAAGSNEIRIDNFTIVSGRSVVPIYELYEVTDFTTTDAWSEISPANGQAPTRSFDLSVDLIDSGILNMVSGRNKNWYRSTSSGASWSTVDASSDKRTFLTSGDVYAIGGTDGVYLIADGNRNNPIDKTGNLAVVWGSIGTIQKILAL